MEKYISTKAICPFYNHENRAVVFCQSWMEGAVLRLSFANCAECFKYKKEFCKGNYSNCHIAKMLNGVFSGGVEG